MKDSKIIMSILKSTAQSMGYTQYALAKKLRVSHPTLKRWFSGKGISLVQLESVMNFLEVSWEDISVELARKSAPKFKYSIEQERYLAKNQKALALFDLLVRGHSIPRILKQTRIPRKQVLRHLSSLERIGLLEVHPKYQVRLKVKGEPTWRKNGPLAQAYRIQGINEFLSQNSSQVKFSIVQCSEQDTKKIISMISEVSDSASAADKRSRISKDVHATHGLILGFSQFEWSVLKL